MDMASKLFTFTFTFTPHRASTRHYRKGSPGIKAPNTNQHSSCARLQHSNHPPSLPTRNRVITRSAGRNWLQVLILVRGQPRAGAETSGKAIGWNWPPREDRSTIQARSQRRRGEDLPCDAAA